jgi:hypothetical protein
LSRDFTEEEYMNPQLDTFSGLTVANREWVYECYREYKKLRTKRNEWDEAQLANHLLGRVWEHRQGQVGPGSSCPRLKVLP